MTFKPYDLGLRELKDSTERKTLIVIPARMESKRLPGKPLLMADGQALVHWTYAQAKNTKADYVVVTSPDREIGKYCDENGITWFPSSAGHLNGTSRCAEVVERTKIDFDRVVNWQVDEPLLRPDDVNTLLEYRGDTIGTLVTESDFDQFDVSNVKVVWDSMKCYWFSREPMRGAGLHIGIYSFSPTTLGKLFYIKMSKYSKAEQLEQLMWIENSFRICPEEVAYVPTSINTPEDWDNFKVFVEETNDASS